MRSIHWRLWLTTMCLVWFATPGSATNGPCGTEVVFDRLRNTALDAACLSEEEEGGGPSFLRVGNLGSSGCDGFVVHLGELTGTDPGVNVTLDEMPELPLLMGVAVRGRLGAVDDALLWESRADDDGTGGIGFSADFSALGATTYQLELYRDGALVHTSTGRSGVSARVERPTAILVENWWIEDVRTICIPLEVYPDIVIWDFGTTTQGPVDVEIVGEGMTVAADRIEVRGESPTMHPDFLSRFELTAGGVPEIRVLSEAVSGSQLDPCQRPASSGSDVLYLNGRQGGDGGEFTVGVDDGERIWATILLPEAGGPGRYVVHADAGRPTNVTETPLPASVGTSCFPFLLPGGAAPLAVWNNVGKTALVGSSIDFDGSSIPDPESAPTVFLLLHDGDAKHLPVGSEVTFQGVILDPAAPSPKSASTTNAVTLRVD